MNQPVISVITVTYNAEAYLEATIQSILQQTYPHIEYLIIDGNSKDKTVDIIQKYADKIAYWISEPDKGLYDAMNKGIQAAKGEYILFMNAGDWFYNQDVLSNAFQQNTANADIYYGETQVIDDITQQPVGLRSEVTPHQLPKQLKWQDMQRGMVVCHQAFIVRRNIVPLYDLKYRYSADVDWVIKCLKKSQNTVNTNQIMAIFRQGGLSTQKRKKSLMERFNVLKTHFGLLQTLWNHAIILLRGIFFTIKRRETYWKN